MIQRPSIWCAGLPYLFCSLSKKNETNKKPDRLERPNKPDSRHELEHADGYLFLLSTTGCGFRDHDAEGRAGIGESPACSDLEKILMD